MLPEFSLIRCTVNIPRLAEAFIVMTTDRAAGYVYRQKRVRWWGYGRGAYRAAPGFDSPETAAKTLLLALQNGGVPL
jgi:hypothetical protein